MDKTPFKASGLREQVFLEDYRSPPGVFVEYLSKIADTAMLMRPDAKPVPHSIWNMSVL